MAETKRPKLEQVVTPIGTLKFPKLNAPDMKFAKNGVGSYSAKIVLTGDEAAPIIKRINELADEMLIKGKADLEEKIANAKGEAKGKAKKALAEFALTDKPYKECYDDQGEPNGNYEFNFKMSSQYVDKAEKIIKLFPSVFDAKGQKMDPLPPIWGGTRARVSGQYNPFATALGAGCALRLAGVKIITLVSGGGASADAMGFGGEEEGYAADAAAKSDPMSSDESGAAAAGDGNQEDF